MWCSGGGRSRADNQLDRDADPNQGGVGPQGAGRPAPWGTG